MTVNEQLTLMGVFAHPDDEVFIGATLAKYSDRGVRTVLVTATRGEEGEILDPDLVPDEVRGRLGEIREAELRRSAEILGISQLYVLGFRDSGMAGTPANEDSRNFHNADPDDALERLVRIVRHEKPQVVITDDERGTYGHPDHLAAHRASVAAFDAASDPGLFPDAGPGPWQVQKLYYPAFSRTVFQRMRDLLRDRGIPWGPEGESEEWLNFTVDDDLITTHIDAMPYRSRVQDAMRAHRTQIPSDDPWLTLPDHVIAQLQLQDTFRRGRCLVTAPLPEDDLFAGIDPSRGLLSSTHAASGD
ncbi:MAG: mycothiol conjugate amidase Mca [Chloroflexota bacterium]